ncbi:MAG: ABC transporter permease [Pleomorphochaeta sp.]
MKEKTKNWLMLSPVLIIIVGLFGGGFIYGLVQSLNYIPIIGQYEVNLDAYKAILQDKEFLSSLGFTFWIALGSTFFSIVVAIILSMGLRKRFKRKGAVLFAYQFPLPIPHIVSGIAILFLFGQSGFIARILALLGIIESSSQFPEMIFDSHGIGIILALMWKFVPFVGVALVGILQTTGTAYEEAAISLGANSWNRFRYVLLPMMLPSISTSSILIFAYAFGSYEIPFLLGSTYPKALSIVAYQKFTNIDLAYRSQAMAMSTIIAVIVLFIVIVYRRLSSKVRY